MTLNVTPHERRIWPWILVAAVVVIAVIVAAVAWVLSNQRAADPQTSPPVTASSSPTESATPIEDAAPTGCLGGPNRDAAMVLAAQAAAPHTSNGAVEVAAALVRWTFQFPSPSASEAGTISSEVIAATASDGFRDLAGAFESTPNNSGGAVADGTAYNLSTVPGVWHLETASADSATVSIGAAYVVDGALSPQLRSSTTFDLVWDAGQWRVESGSIARTTEELFEIGTAFTGGC